VHTKRTFKIQKLKIKMAILQVLKNYFKNLQSFFKAGKVHNKNLGKTALFTKFDIV